MRDLRISPLVKSDLAGELTVNEKEISCHQHHTGEPPGQPYLQGVGIRCRVLERQPQSWIGAGWEHIWKHAECDRDQHSAEEAGRCHEGEDVAPLEAEPPRQAQGLHGQERQHSAPWCGAQAPPDVRLDVEGGKGHERHEHYDRPPEP